MEFSPRSKLIFLKIFLLLTLSGCSYIKQNINTKNTLIFESFCDRWSNRRISDKQIIKEFSLYDVNGLDEIKVICKKYNYPIKEIQYCLDWLNKTYSYEQTLNRFRYFDEEKGLNDIKKYVKNIKK